MNPFFPLFFPTWDILTGLKSLLLGCPPHPTPITDFFSEQNEKGDEEGRVFNGVLGEGAIEKKRERKEKEKRRSSFVLVIFTWTF